MARYCLTIFLSAFLLFQVQPLIGRYILPWFGGSPGVWTTCLLFFQSMLLLGYAYAHGISQWCSPRVQCFIHSLALLATLFMLPITPNSAWKLTEMADPTWYILLLLLLCVGAPYVFLSATAPLIQSWVTRTHPASSPYRLYALSNVGSLMGLLTYPLVVERFLSLEAQAALWSGAYVTYVLLCVVASIPLFFLHAKSATQGNETIADDRAQRPTMMLVMLWLSLACCGSVMLLAATNVMCRDVASVPFLWVLPLALYLFSFIVCFDREHWYHRDLFGVLLIVSLGVQLLLSFSGGMNFPLWFQLAHYCVLLTVICFVCHGELVRLKPSPRFLTQFYLAVSGGGALGGVFVSLVAPNIFPDYYEFYLAIGGCVVLLLLMYRLDRWASLGPASLRLEIRRTVVVGACIAGIVLLAISGISFAAKSGFFGDTIISAKRNFYGSLKVFRQFGDTPESRMVLAHGSTVHGFQYQESQKRSLPTSYYANESGIGVAIQNYPGYLAGQGPIRLGVIGQGTGTLACYTRAGDYLRFYEIDPLVVEFSNQHFSFLSDAQQRGANVDTYLGDARVVMERQLLHESGERFDILAIDAFSSDAIPVHLLTWECFQVYRQHLKSNGIMAFHVSNRHLDLSTVVRGLAKRSSMNTIRIRSRPAESTDGLPTGPASSSDWVLVTNNEQFILDDVVRAALTPLAPDAPSPLLWTDDFSNLFQVLSH